MYEVFKAEIVKEKRLRKLTNANIASMTGLSVSAINMFMASSEGKKRDDSRKVAEAISKALGIEL
jgi:predicted transcriptional regulator